MALLYRINNKKDKGVSLSLVKWKTEVFLVMAQ